MIVLALKIPESAGFSKILISFRVRPVDKICYPLICTAINTKCDGKHCTFFTRSKLKCKPHENKICVLYIDKNSKV